MKRGLEINPNDVEIARNTGTFLSSRGLAYSALKLYSKATELDPLYARGFAAKGIIYTYYLGEYDKAEMEFKKALEIDPDQFHALAVYPELCLSMGNYNLAKELLTRFLSRFKEQLPDNHPAFIYANALLHIINGEKEKALALYPEGKTEIYYYCRMSEETISSLSKNFERNRKAEHSWYLSLINDPGFDFIRSDPRFKDILEKYKLLYEENLEKYGEYEL
jgi:tetratricopeptide (TPR) repeat protein